MNLYFTRVELHRATELDYIRLHAAMANAGFSRSVVADDKNRYHLPPAEYVITSGLGSQTILNAANNAVSTIGKTGAVLVMEAKEWRSVGLVQVAR